MYNCTCNGMVPYINALQLNSILFPFLSSWYRYKGISIQLFKIIHAISISSIIYIRMLGF